MSTDEIKKEFEQLRSESKKRYWKPQIALVSSIIFVLMLYFFAGLPDYMVFFFLAMALIGLAEYRIDKLNQRIELLYSLIETKEKNS